jgi:phasin family protein
MASYSKKPPRPSPKFAPPPMPAAKPEAPAPWIEARAPEIVEAPATQPIEAPAAEFMAPVAPEAVESSAAPEFEAPAAEVESFVAPVAPEALETPAAPVFETPAAPAAAAVKADAEATLEASAAVVQDLQNNVRSIVEKGLVEGRANFTHAKTAAEEAAAAVEASFGAARDGVIALNVKALEAFKAEADANLDMLTSLVGAKTVSDLVTLQSEFTRKRFEGAATNAKAFVELARKVADDTVAPLKAHVAKTFNVAV